MRALLPLLALLVACKPAAESSCAAYASAASACAIAHGADPSVYDLDAACAGWDDTHEAHYVDYYGCRAAAYEGADCSTDEGYAAARLAEACCAPPGATASTDSACGG